MAGTLIQRPVSVYPYGRGSWGYFGSGATSTVNAVNETVTNDATYIRLNADYGTAATYGASIKFKTTPGQLPAGAKAMYMRAVVRAKTTNTANEEYFRLRIQNISAGNPNGTNWLTTGGQLKSTTSFKQLNNVIEKLTTSDARTFTGRDGSVRYFEFNFFEGVFYAGDFIDQTALNNLVLEIHSVESTSLQFSQAWIEIPYDEKPVVDLAALGTVSNTTSPVLMWDYTDDLMPQQSFDVQILDNSGNVFFEALKVVSSRGYYGIPVNLPVGSYTAKVRAYQKWDYPGPGPVSDWDTISFSIDIGYPGTPEISVTPEPELGRTTITTEINLNMLSQGAAEGDVAAWNDPVNAKILPGIVPDTGDRSFIMELSGGASPYTRGVSLIPVTAGQIYGFAAKVFPYPGDPQSPVSAGLAWYKADGTLISQSYGSAVNETVSWVRPFIRIAAPVDAAFVRPQVMVNSTAAGAWHYWDSAVLVPLATLADPVPAWSRGGFLFESDSLISYGDSTLESTSHWTADNASTAVEVISYDVETNMSDQRYQGDSALKLNTVGTLARRDNETATIATGTALVINKGDVVEGDVMLAIINGTQTTITPPSGWTLAGGPTDDGTAVRAWVYWKVAGNAEPTTYTWTLGVSGKHSGHITSWDGIDTVSPIHAITLSAAPAAATAIATPATTVPHNGVVVQAVVGRTAATTTPTTWTTNLGTGSNYDAQLTTTANTANEVAYGCYSLRFNTGVVTSTAVAAKTMTANKSITDAVAITVVLKPAVTTAVATLKVFEYYPITPGDSLVATGAFYGADTVNSSNSANRSATVWVDLYDANKVSLGAAFGVSATCETGGWKVASGVISTASEPLARFASLRVQVAGITDLEAYYVDAISLYKGTVNRGYVEGYKQNSEVAKAEIEYSEDNGVTWSTSSSVNGLWMIKQIEDATTPLVTFHDYEAASGVDRVYRVYNWKIEEGNLLRSPYSNESNATLLLKQLWLHLVTDPEGTSTQFFFDGTGRDDSFDKQATTLQFAGREYPQLQFGEGSARSISGSVQLPTKAEFEALKMLDRTKVPIIFRDGRGKRAKGMLEVRFSDINWGNTATYTFTVLGLQP